MKRWMLIVVALFIFVPQLASAQDSESTNYQCDDCGFNSGGSLDSSSTNYEARTSTGEQGVGNSESTNFQADGGSITPSDERLELTISNATVDFGEVDPSTTKTGTANFSVLAYYAQGYSVQIVGEAPRNDGYVLTTPSTPTASSVGTEQFGINLASNTSPATFGAGPVQVPDSTFSNGQVDADYNTANQYMFADGDQIAFSNEESGQTDYTISFIMNVSNVTAGGTYTGSYSIVATATY